MPDKYFVEQKDMEQVADAIRAKTGKTEQLAFPQGFADAINAIVADGGKLDMVVPGNYIYKDMHNLSGCWENTVPKHLGNGDYSLDTAGLKGYIIPNPYPSDALVGTISDTFYTGRTMWEEIDLNDAEVFHPTVHVSPEDGFDASVPTNPPKLRIDAFLVKKGNHAGVITITWGGGDFGTPV